MMDRHGFTLQLEKTLEVAPGTLSKEQSIRDLEHWDSLKLLQILMFAEEQLGIEIDEDRLAQCVTFGDVLTLMSELEFAKLPPDPEHQ